MSEAERTECLQLISSLEQTLQQQKALLKNLEKTNADLWQKLTDTEQRLSGLKALFETNQILLSDLQTELASLKADLDAYEKLLKDYERQIRWLKIKAWIYGGLGFLIGRFIFPL